MKKKKKRLPDFNKMSYKEEANWWDTHDLGDYWDEFKSVDIEFVPREKREETITIRVEPKIKEKLENKARNSGINLSSLARMWLIEKLRQAS